MGPTDPNEQYFFRGLWGWVTDQWKKLIADAAGHLQVDVLESGLPTGASTSANQTTMITALQLIDDLRGALDSVATDELLTVFHSQDVDVEVKQTTPADLTPGIEGWDGSAWHKLPLLWGYSSIYNESKQDLEAASPNDTLVTTGVAAGHLHVLEVVSAFNNTSLSTSILLAVTSGGISATFLPTYSPAAGYRCVWVGKLVLAEGDTITAFFNGVTAGDDLYMRLHGYKMKIAE